jgi:hypothetical protein
MLADVEWCERCGFTCDEAAAGQAARMIRTDAGRLAAILAVGGANLPGRPEPGRWSPLHTVHEVRHHLRDVGEQVADMAAVRGLRLTG